MSEGGTYRRNNLLNLRGKKGRQKYRDCVLKGKKTGQMKKKVRGARRKRTIISKREKELSLNKSSVRGKELKGKDEGGKLRGRESGHRPAGKGGFSGESLNNGKHLATLGKFPEGKRGGGEVTSILERKKGCRELSNRVSNKAIAGKKPREAHGWRRCCKEEKACENVKKTERSQKKLGDGGTRFWQETGRLRLKRNCRFPRGGRDNWCRALANTGPGGVL